MKKSILFLSIFTMFFISANAQKTGSFTDSRDGKIYQTVEIGEHVWMAENLNFNMEGASWCYDNSPANCTRYGRLYTWHAARKACPEGWMLPTRSHFRKLQDCFQFEDDPFSELVYGSFKVVFAGWRGLNERFGHKDFGTHFWTSTTGNRLAGQWWSASSQDEDYGAVNFNIYSGSQTMQFGFAYEDLGFSVRCVKVMD